MQSLRQHRVRYRSPTRSLQASQTLYNLEIYRYGEIISPPYSARRIPRARRSPYSALFARADPRQHASHLRTVGDDKSTNCREDGALSRDPTTSDQRTFWRAERSDGKIPADTSMFISLCHASCNVLVDAGHPLLIFWLATERRTWYEGTCPHSAGRRSSLQPHLSVQV